MRQSHELPEPHGTLVTWSTRLVGSFGSKALSRLAGCALSVHVMRLLECAERLCRTNRRLHVISCYIAAFAWSIFGLWCGSRLCGGRGEQLLQDTAPARKAILERQVAVVL